MFILIAVQADQNACKDGEPKLSDATGMCVEFHDRKLNKNKNQAKDIGVPVIVTEFGACSNSEACYYEMIGFEKAADKYLTSWAYWMFKSYYDHTTTAAENQEGIFNEDGTIQKMKEKALSRTYIQYFQGLPLEVFFGFFSVRSINFFNDLFVNFSIESYLLFNINISKFCFIIIEINLSIIISFIWFCIAFIIDE